MLKKDDDFFSLCKTIGSNLDKTKSLAQDVLHHPKPMTSFKTLKKEIQKPLTVKYEEKEHKTSGPSKISTQVKVQKALDVILIDDDDDDKPDNQNLEKLKQKENLETTNHHLTQTIISSGGKRIPVFDLEEDIVFQDNPRVDKMQKLNNSQSKNIVSQKSTFQGELTPYRPVKGTKLEYFYLNFDSSPKFHEGKHQLLQLIVRW